MILVFFADGELVELVHILQKPKIVMQPGSLLAFFHHFAQVQILHVDGMHIHVLSFALLQTEFRLRKRGLENIIAIVAHSIAGLHLSRKLRFLGLFSNFFGFLVKISPNDFTWLFLFCDFQTTVTFDNCHFLILEVVFFVKEGRH